ARELLAYRLGTIHNLRFVQRQMAAIRAAIVAGTFDDDKRTFLDRYQVSNAATAREQKQRWSAARQGSGGR
ncbi:MAG TPA: tRNA guanosine(34) transglycosylase Tgt, partial [Nitrolancea sp.]|nr:tRNA guanosine(34) transglycosylase Tgt [Nitrolancea sp.]